MSSNSRGVVRELLTSMSARLVVLPLAAVAAILTTRLVNETLGPESFAVYSIVAGLPLLLTFTAFGLGAPTTNAAATATTDPLRFQSVLRKSLAISFSIACLVATASILFGAAGLWSGLLGLPDTDLNVPISVAMIIFGFSIPGGLGSSILVGFGRYSASVIIQGLIPVFSLGVVGAAIYTGGRTAGVVAVSSIGIFLANWIGFVFAARAMPGTWADYRRRPQRGVMGEVISTAIPAMFLVAGGAALYQSGRLVLSHTSTLQQVAIYSALWTFFQPLMSVVQAAAIPLWHRFAAARAEGRAIGREFSTAVFTSAIIGLFAGLGLTILGPAAVHISTAGKVEADLSQCAVLGAALVVYGMTTSAGMVLTFPRGLWLMSVAQWVSAAIVVAIGAWASARIGATAPMVGLLVALTVGLAIPTITAARMYLSNQQTGSSD
jgi:O-antigen/teichoic acid export membrane protein